jgi:hypothetical protein
MYITGTIMDLEKRIHQLPTMNQPTGLGFISGVLNNLNRFVNEGSSYIINNNVNAPLYNVWNREIQMQRYRCSGDASQLTGFFFATGNANTGASVPSQVTITSLVNEGSSIGVFWTTAPTATGYNVYRKVDNGAYSQYVATSSTSTSDAAVADGFTYTYYIVGMNTIGTGAGSTPSGLLFFTS